MSELCANARRHLTEGEHDGTEAVADSLLCRSCYRRLEQRIAELPALAGWLEANVAASGRSGEPVSGSRHPPVPVSLTVLALLGRAHDCFAENCPGGHDPVGADDTPSIPSLLDAWVRIVLEEHPDRLHGPDSTISACAAWLIIRLDWIAAQEWVPEICREVDSLTSSINGAAPWLPAPEAKPLYTPCPKCELRALVWCYPWYECDPRHGGCGSLMSQVEYEIEAHRWAVWAKDRQVV